MSQRGVLSGRPSALNKPTCLPLLRFAQVLSITLTNQREYAPFGISDDHCQKTDKRHRKVIRKELTFLDIREAVLDGQKVFDAFVITGKLLSTKNLNADYEK